MDRGAGNPPFASAAASLLCKVRGIVSFEVRGTWAEFPPFPCCLPLFGGDLMRAFISSETGEKV